MCLMRGLSKRLIIKNLILIIISAGFDAHQADPLANLNLVESDFQKLPKN